MNSNVQETLISHNSPSMVLQHIRHLLHYRFSTHRPLPIVLSGSTPAPLMGTSSVSDLIQI